MVLRKVVRRKRRVFRKKKALPKTAFNKIKRLAYKCNVKTTSFTNVQMTTAGVLDHLTGIAQGSDFNQRRGNAIEPRLLRIEATVILNDATAGASAGDQYRILVIQGTKTAATPFALADLFEDVTNAPLTVRSWYNNDNVKMKIDSKNSEKTMAVLYDSGVQLISNCNNTALAGYLGANPGWQKRHRIRIPASKMRQVEYSGTAGNTYLNSPITILYLSSLGVGAHSPLMSYSCQLYYDNVI